MKLSRQQLIFRAMVVLNEAVEQSGRGPVRPSLGVRFALMYLYAVGSGDRKPFDDFWTNLQESYAYHPETARSYLRPTTGRAYMAAIARSVGIDLDVEYDRELSIACMSSDERRAVRERDAQLAEHRRRMDEERQERMEQERFRISEAAKREKPRRDCGWL